VIYVISGVCTLETATCHMQHYSKCSPRGGVSSIVVPNSRVVHAVALRIGKGVLAHYDKPNLSYAVSKGTGFGRVQQRLGTPQASGLCAHCSRQRPHLVALAVAPAGGGGLPSGALPSGALCSRCRTLNEASN
jgi:hypothetical protein